MKIHTELAQPLGAHNAPCQLVPTRCLDEIIHHPFDHYNPPQSDFVLRYSRDKNFVVAVPTSAGKTYMAEIAMAFHHQAGSRSLYMSPLKALAEEKLDDWKDPSHSFQKHELNIGIITGDHSGKRDQILSRSDIVLASYEIIDHITKFKKRCDLIDDIGCVVIDEGHNIADPGRGGNLEFALSRITKVIPGAQVIFLSASVPNTDDVAKWLTVLNNKPTEIVSSDYRPCQLHEVFLQIPGSSGPGGGYTEDIHRKEAVLAVIEKHRGKQGIIFVSNKVFGYGLTRWLKTEHQIESEFHCADIPLTERKRIENAFKNKDLDIIVSTPTLAQGVNLPAHYVVVSDTKRGNTRVSPQEVQQCCGRAGRPKYDTEGHAYIILRQREVSAEKARLKNGALLVSSLSSAESFAPHILSDISHGNLKTQSDVYNWYRRTYSHIQTRQTMTKDFCNSIISLLYACRMLKRDGHFFELTPLGRVSVNMYIHPITIADWFYLFRDVERIDTGVNNVEIDAKVCWALGGAWDFAPENPSGIVLATADSRCVKAVEHVGAGFKTKEKPWQAKAAGGLLQILWSGNKTATDSFSISVKKDISRWVSALGMIQSMYAQYDRSKGQYVGWDYEQHEFQVLAGRMCYGVSRELIPLVTIKGIGAVFAGKLYKAGIKKPSDFAEPKKARAAKTILGANRYEQISQVLHEHHGVDVACEFLSVF